MTMIERVARAIDASVWGDQAGLGIDDERLRAEFVATRRRVSLKRARAAIEAMREPDEVMIDAADNLYGVTRHVAARIFHAMIAAALGEGRDG